MRSERNDSALLRTAGWLRVIAAGVLVAGASGAILLARGSGSRLTVMGLGVLALFGGGALAESWLSRIEIGPDRLLIVKGFRRRVVPRREIESVRWEWGSGVSVRLVDGSWVRLPDLGLNSQGVSNRVRAWLKRTEGGPGPPAVG